MAFVLAVLGGAAAVEISKLLHKDKQSPKDIRSLEKKEYELQQILQASCVQMHHRVVAAANRLDVARACRI